MRAGGEVVGGHAATVATSDTHDDNTGVGHFC